MKKSPLTEKQRQRRYRPRAVREPNLDAWTAAIERSDLRDSVAENFRPAKNEPEKFRK